MVNNIANYLPSSMLHNPYGFYGNGGASGLYGTNSIYGYGYGLGCGEQDYSYYFLQDQNTRNTTQEASLVGGAAAGACVAGLIAKGASMGIVGGALGVGIGAAIGLLAGIFINKIASK